MLGYTENQVSNMMEACIIARELVDSPSLKADLKDAAYFLEGLLAEGRI